MSIPTKASLLTYELFSQPSWTGQIVEICTWKLFESNDICNINDKELDYWLAQMVMEIRRKDCSEYSPTTLTNIVPGLQRHIREKDRHIKKFEKEDPTFATQRVSLDAKMKELAAAGVSVETNSCRRDLGNANFF